MSVEVHPGEMTRTSLKVPLGRPRMQGQDMRLVAATTPAGQSLVFELTGSGIVRAVHDMDPGMTEAEWERGEVEATAYLAAGEVEVFDGPEDFLAALG